MAQYQYQQPFSFQDQSQLLLATDSFDYNFTYGQYEDPRSKTPTSLINHSGRSPSGPLSTPPMSRNPSQVPHQPPEFMVCDDSVNSPSNSPTSITTPDNDSVDFEMLDQSQSDAMMDSYNHHSNPTLMASHVSHDGMMSLQTDIIPDQVVQQALNDTLAASHHFPYHHQTISPQSSSNMYPSGQFYNQNYGQNFTTQTYRNDHWANQRSSFNNAMPRSGVDMFNPTSDRDMFSTFTNSSIGYWVDNTDSEYLVSPNEPAPQPHDRFSFSNPDSYQNYQHTQYQDRSPVDMTVTLPSPTPDSQNFVNYDQNSTLFTDSYITAPQFHSFSPGASNMAQGSSYPSSVGNLSRSSSTMGQATHSPYQQPAPSPSGSDGMLSLYQHQEPYPEVAVHEHHEHFDNKSAPPPSPGSNSRTSEPSPEPELEPTARRARAPASGKGHAGRPGGRALGTHLEPTVAKAAHDMRKIVACWHCVLQRDKCGPGDVCERCVKRAQRPNADCGLGCSRIKLVELTEYFLPTLVTTMHENQQLSHYVSTHIRQWGTSEITILMTCGQKSMPRIDVKVFEFAANDNELLFQIQYKKDPNNSDKRMAVVKASPPLGMVHINANEEKRFDKYVSDIVDHHIDAFGAICWVEDDNDFQENLFRLITRVKPKTDDEAKLLREVLRLIVCTFIMSHTLTLSEEDKHAALSKMQSYKGRESYVENFTSPRMTNRQLKYFFNRIHGNIMCAVLNKLQQIFKSSKGCDKWIMAFIVVIGMCMAHEDQQKTIHLIMETKSKIERWDRKEAQARAELACRDIDSRMGFITQIFRWKYNRKCNPLRDANLDWEKEVGFGDASSVNFVRQVAQLIKENIDFLQVRQGVSISEHNQTKYTSRLVGRFLLSFWLPQM